MLTVGIYPSSDGHLEVHVEQLPPAADYQIYRGDALGSWTPIADLGALDPYIGGDFVDTGISIASGSVFRYAVYDGNGNQLDSTTLVTGIQLSGTAIGNTAHLSWNTDPSFNFQLFGGNVVSYGLYLGNASSYTDTGLDYNSWYNYTLSENTYNQWSSFEVWTPPGAMDGITAQLVPGVNEIDIAAPDNGMYSGWGNDSFGVMNVYRGTTPDFTPDADHRIATGVTSFADTTVAPGTTYYYQATNLAPYTGLESLPVSASVTTPGGEPIITARSIDTTAGTAYSGPVATFSQSGTDGQPTDYSATINWGDGTPTGTTEGASPDLVITINPDGT